MMKSFFFKAAMTSKTNSNSLMSILATSCLLASLSGFACAADSHTRVDSSIERVDGEREASSSSARSVLENADLEEPVESAVEPLAQPFAQLFAQIDPTVQESVKGIENTDHADAIAEDLRKEFLKLQRMLHDQREEIVSLYQRLHIELDRQGRSNLVIDLFADHRIEIQLLGFELVERDLSNQSDVPPEIGQVTRDLIHVQNPLIRAKAASLITRLVLPDAMLLLTDALANETDPIAAEPMLSGIARWPNEQACEPVMRWLLREDSLIGSASDAAWSLEELGLWDSERDHATILNRLRQVPEETLTLSSMKLLAKVGSSQDLELLVSLLSSENSNQQQSAASALVETPRATEVLIRAAELNSRFFTVASTSLALHRATPEGFRRLSALPAPDADARADAFVRMGAAIDADRLSEAVKLASIEPELAILILNRLLNAEQPINARSAKGILQLVSLEFKQSRPNRALEGVRSLDGVRLDASDQMLVDRYKVTALILLGKLDEANGLEASKADWLEAFSQVQDAQLLSRIAQTVVETYRDSLTDEERELLKPYLVQEVEEEPVEGP